MTNILCNIWSMLVVGPHIASHIGHDPLQWPDNTFLDHYLQVVVLDTLITEGIDVGVPILSLTISMLRSQLTSIVGWRELIGCCVGSPYLHPLSHLGPTSKSSVSVAIILGCDQYADFIPYINVIIQSQVHFCWSICCGWGGHDSEGRKSARSIYAGWKRRPEMWS